jgi:hypothetical protein
MAASNPNDAEFRSPKRRTFSTIVKLNEALVLLTLTVLPKQESEQESKKSSYDRADYRRNDSDDPV